LFAEQNVGGKFQVTSLAFLFGVRFVRKGRRVSRSNQSITFIELRRRHAIHQTAITAWRITAGHNNATPCSLKPRPGESKDGDGGYVVKQHRDDQSSSGTALRVIARKLAGDTRAQATR